MKINNITTGFYSPKFKNLKNNTENNTEVTHSRHIEYLPAYSYISFKAKNKKINPENETQKLLKQFDSILASDMDIDGLIRLYERQLFAQMEQKKKKADELLKEAEMLEKATYLNPQQMAERMLTLEKEFNSIQKNLLKFKPFVIPKPVAPELDNALISRFKFALQEDNYNLDKVFKAYYASLNEINSIEDLHKNYPKIEIPDNPADVVAKKISEILTRDFYENLDVLMHKKDEQEIYNFVTGKIKEIIKQSRKTDTNEIYALVVIPACEIILDKYDKLRTTDAFASVPQFRKNKTIQISDNDVKLLAINFDDFVLHVLREHYLNDKKLNDITYTEKGLTIPVASLKENCYKFDKISEKIRAMILAAKQIQAAKRDYENFDDTKLRESLNNLAASEVGNNEEIFEHIVAFDSCNFGEQDKKYLIKFLRLLDSLKDNELSEEQALEIIKKENLRPLETETLNELEKQNVVESLKLRQKQALQLNFMKSEFDSAMNLLYQNDLSNVAAICAKYRPVNLDEESIQNAKFVINLVLSNDNDDFTNVKNTIKNWDTYNYYKDNEYSLFSESQKYAAKQDGSIDINKAGIYLGCAEIVLNSEQALEYLPDKDIVSAVIQKSGSQKKAIEHLSKYEEYKQLSPEQKSHLLNFVDNFNPKDNVEKFILKNIIENEYAKTDTVSKANVNSNDTVDVTITASAKQQILDKYMFPGCLDFMCDFERAMTSFATERGTSGIKRTTKNNKAMEYKMEIKLANHDDRLFASKKDYCFDVFSDKGLH